MASFGRLLILKCFRSYQPIPPSQDDFILPRKEVMKIRPTKSERNICDVNNSSFLFWFVFVSRSIFALFFAVTPLIDNFLGHFLCISPMIFLSSFSLLSRPIHGVFVSTSTDCATETHTIFFSFALPSVLWKDVKTWIRKRHRGENQTLLLSITSNRIDLTPFGFPCIKQNHIFTE